MGGWVGGLCYLVIKREALVGVLHELVHGEHGVVRLHHRIRDLDREEVGGWVGWIDEDEAVRMSCWTLWVGGWVGGWVCGRLYLGGRNDSIRGKDAIRELLTNLAQEEGPHATARPTTQGVGELEAWCLYGWVGGLID